MIVDSHCHLIHEKNALSIDEIINNAKRNNVRKLLNISTNKDDFKQCIRISETYEDVFTSIGIHPHESNQMNKDIYEKILKLSSNKKVIAIGETGLDYYYENSEKNKQIDSFLKQINISQETNLPLIIHMRNAETDMLNIINDEFKKRPFVGLFHCYTGSLKFAKHFIPMGFYFSISGIVTFKNSNDLRNTVSHLPRDKILIETDSPYLAPVPMRGRVNEPSFIIHTLEYIAKLFNLTNDELMNMTSKNFFKLFVKAKEIQ